MGKRLTILFLLAVALLANVSTSYAQGYVELDWRLAKYIGLNTTSAMVWENGRTANVDTQKQIHDSVQVRVATMAAIKEVALKSLDNTSYFGYESWIYKNIYKQSTEIVNNAVALAKRYNDLKLHVTCLLELECITTRCTSLFSAFADVVNNGRLNNPWSKPTGDGKNFLNRIDRMKMANAIMSDLYLLNSKLKAMLWSARYLGFEKVLYRIDRESWSNMWGGIAAKEQLKYRWRNFRHRY